MGDPNTTPLALARHYLAYRGTPEARAGELNLMRKMVSDHALTFRVGVSEDERTQDLYGAAGVPTMAIIDVPERKDVEQNPVVGIELEPAPCRVHRLGRSIEAT